MVVTLSNLKLSVILGTFNHRL